MENVSRRGFIKNAAAGVAGGAVLGSLTVAGAQADETPASSFEEGVNWSAEYDVVVLGCGMAGVVSAISAADEGADVLIVEKAPVMTAGGNSRVASGGVIGCDPDKLEPFTAYLKCMAPTYNTPSEELIEMFAQKSLEMRDWYDAHGGNMKIMEGWHGPYTDFEGWEALNYYGEGDSTYDAAMYHAMLHAAQGYDNITIWYGTPAVELIQDPATKVVCGAVVSGDGELLNVRARNGVVLATGGFESNQQMIQDYLHLPEGYPKGSEYNTGDAILMAQAVGADLWHMCNVSGPDLDVVNMDTRHCFVGGAIRLRGAKPSRETSAFTAHSVVIVGRDGTRFCNEAQLPDHGFINFHGRKITSPYSLPAYVVFDRDAFAFPMYPVWGTNDEKLEEGVIVKADSLDELNALLGLPEGSLAATVATYNEYCANGEDPEFGRAVDYLLPLREEGPYYAAELKPTFVNTQGGPRRDINACVIDTKGNPIPHLYSAGECGSIWSDVYPGGGNITECIVFGRIAGANAAQEKDDTVRERLADNGAYDFTAELPTFAAEADNEYVGMAYGIGDALWVKVVLDGERIADVQVLHSWETPGIGDKALAALPAAVIEAQTPEIDVYTGATSTSKAFLAAVKDALVQAGWTFEG